MVFPSMDYENMSECLIILTIVQIMGIGIMYPMLYGLALFCYSWVFPSLYEGFWGCHAGMQASEHLGQNYR
jgi:hypothetical protein